MSHRNSTTSGGLCCSPVDSTQRRWPVDSAKRLWLVMSESYGEASKTVSELESYPGTDAVVEARVEVRNRMRTTMLRTELRSRN